MNMNTIVPCSEVFYKKNILRDFTKFTRKQLCQACNFIKKETLAQVFPVNFTKFLRTPPVAASGSFRIILIEELGCVF